MKRYILVCAFSDTQLVELLRNQPFFELAYRTQTLRRVRSIDDIRGLAHCETLYLLPDYTKGTRDHLELQDYWSHSCRNRVVALTEDHVRGREIFTGPEEKHHQHEMHDHAPSYADFPKYVGKPRTPLRYAEEDRHDADWSGTGTRPTP